MKVKSFYNMGQRKSRKKRKSMIKKQKRKRKNKNLIIGGWWCQGYWGQKVWSSDEFLFQSQLFMKYIYIFFEKCKQTFFLLYIFMMKSDDDNLTQSFFLSFFSSYMYIKIKKCNNFIKTNIEIETFFNFTKKKKFGKQFFSCFFFYVCLCSCWW